MSCAPNDEIPTAPRHRHQRSAPRELPAPAATDHLPDRVIETFSHVAPEVEQRLLDGLEARWWGANMLLHPQQPQAAFRTLLVRVGRWSSPAA